MSKRFGIIVLEKPAVCPFCDSELAIGDKAYWDNATRRRICIKCGDTKTERALVGLSLFSDYIENMEIWRHNVNEQLSQILKHIKTGEQNEQR